MKILVTGATGFTGKELCKKLLKLGNKVTALDYKEGIKTQELKDRGADVVIGSVTYKATVQRCVQGVDVVFHLAAAFREINVPEEYYDEVNIEGTRNVLQASHAAGVSKFIYCSTCGVHGNIQNPPAGEDAPIAPADYYQRTKYQAEPIVLDYHRKGMPCVIFRPAAIYGPGDPERFVMIFRRVKKGVFPMFGNGKTYYHPLYIDNLVDAFLLAMQPGKGDGEAYLIADEEYVEIEDLVLRVAESMQVKVRIPHLPVLPLVVLGYVCEKICRPIGVTPPIFPRRVDWFRQNRAFDIQKAKRDLDYQPAVGLDEGLKRTFKWYQGEGYI